MKHATVIRWLIGLTALLAACTPQPALNTVLVFGPKSWIDAPLDGAAVPPNPAVEVTSHSADPLNIVQVELSVNGQTVQSSGAESGHTLVLTKQQWSPPGPGNYRLMVRAQNSAGAWGEYAQAAITIGGAAETVLPTPTPVVVPSSTPIVKTGGATPSPFPAATVAFYADATSLIVGKCTTIHWQVTNVSQVVLDNVAVAQSGSKQDCPSQTTTHTLRIFTLDGQTVQRTLTITVTSPSRTPGPTATRPSPPPPSTGCSGLPVVASFSASPSSIPLGGSSTLSWGAVTNADSVEIDNGIGGVAAPGSRVVSPSVTTIYVLTARCKGVTSTSRTIVTVIQPPTPTRSLRQLPTATRTRTPVIVH